MARKENPSNPLPTPLVRRFVRYVLGFGIATGVALFPYLGKVAGGGALLDLFPGSMKETLLPISVFVMGFIAVAVQFYSGETIHRSVLRRRFKAGLVSLLVGLVLFSILHALLVVRVSYTSKDGKEILHSPFVIGFVKSKGCGCASETNNQQCIEELSFAEEKIATCWNTTLSRLLLQFSYLVLTGGLAALIGLLLLQEEARRQEKTKPAKKKAPRPRRAQPPPAKESQSSGPPEGGPPHFTS
jgi:hypothetical protein